MISTNLIFKKDAYLQSKVFEGILVNQLNAEYFWRDPYKDEVDIIKINQKPLPIEIKYGKIETKGLLKFMKKFNVNKGYVVSLNKERKLEINGKKIIIIPAYKFLIRVMST